MKGISLFDSNDVSLTGTAWRVPRAPRSVASSALPEARADGRRPQPIVELGYNQATRSREMDVLLPVRDPHVFSRYVTGWMVAYRESAELAKRLIEESCQKQGIQPGQLTLHADRGTSMSSTGGVFAGRSGRDQDA